MVESRNHFVEPIGGRRNRRRAGAVALIIEGMKPVQRIIDERIPGAIGSVALPHEYEPTLVEPVEPLEPVPPLTQPVIQHGFNWAGDFV